MFTTTQLALLHLHSANMLSTCIISSLNLLTHIDVFNFLYHNQLTNHLSIVNNDFELLSTAEFSCSKCVPNQFIPCLLFYHVIDVGGLSTIILTSHDNWLTEISLAY